MDVFNVYPFNVYVLIVVIGVVHRGDRGLGGIPLVHSEKIFPIPL